MWVGTSCTWVMRWRSMAASSSSGSNRSMHDRGAAEALRAVVQPAGAAWYSGAGQRYTVSAVKPNMPVSIMVRNDVGAERARRAAAAGSPSAGRSCPTSRTSSRPRTRRRSAWPVRGERRPRGARSRGARRRPRGAAHVASSPIVATMSEASGDDEDAGVAVVDDVPRLVGGQVPVDRRDVEARHHPAPQRVEHLEPVVEDDREVVTGLHARTAQRPARRLARSSSAR